MIIKCRTLGIILIGAAALLFWNEFLVYYFVLIQCYWPSLNPASADSSISRESEPMKAMFLADTHLLGSRGHWFDRLRREWQMQRAFQSALFLFNPEMVFVLGDLLDEGKWSDDDEFDETVTRFQNIFSHSDHTNMQLVVGNHDIGFHYMASKHNVARFRRAFDAPAVKLLRVKNNIFVLLNSVAFEGDQCELCAEAERQLTQVERNLTCAMMSQDVVDVQDPGYCKEAEHLLYTRPIVLQHYPMYRLNDAECEGPDAAPPDEKYATMKQKFDCLSEAASNRILSSLKPRLVIDAHTHHFCRRTLHQGTPEWTVPSFNWRNKVNPSFLLATINNNNFEIGKCYLPSESTVIWTYIVGGVTLLLGLIVLKLFGRQPHFTDRYSKLS